MYSNANFYQFPSREFLRRHTLPGEVLLTPGIEGFTAAPPLHFPSVDSQIKDYNTYVNDEADRLASKDTQPVKEDVEPVRKESTNGVKPPGNPVQPTGFREEAELNPLHSHSFQPVKITEKELSTLLATPANSHPPAKKLKTFKFNVIN